MGNLLGPDGKFLFPSDQKISEMLARNGDMSVKLYCKDCGVKLGGHSPLDSCPCCGSRRIVSSGHYWSTHPLVLIIVTGVMGLLVGLVI